MLQRNVLLYVYSIGPRCQFHQHYSRAFFIRIFQYSKNVTRNITREKLLNQRSYEKFVRIKLMKLTLGPCSNWRIKHFVACAIRQSWIFFSLFWSLFSEQFFMWILLVVNKVCKRYLDQYLKYFQLLATFISKKLNQKFFDDIFLPKNYKAKT